MTTKRGSDVLTHNIVMENKAIEQVNLLFARGASLRSSREQQVVQHTIESAKQMQM
jgi:hypothetical protein